MKLTENFSLSELTRSQTATRKGIDNSPDDAQLTALRDLCANILQPIRDHFGKSVRISSGLRVPELNSAIGGSTTSDHCKGMAADFEIAGVDNRELAIFIRDNMKFKQLILEFYEAGIPDSGWVHCSFDPDNLKADVKTAKKVGGKTVYVAGIE